MAVKFDFGMMRICLGEEEIHVELERDFEVGGYEHEGAAGQGAL